MTSPGLHEGVRLVSHFRACATLKQCCLGHARKEQRDENMHVSALRARHQVKVVLVLQEGPTIIAELAPRRGIQRRAAARAIKGGDVGNHGGSRTRAAVNRVQLHGPVGAHGQGARQWLVEALGKVVRLAKGRPRQSEEPAIYNIT